MAFFYMHTKIVRASSGKSAVAAAAYQSGQSLHDTRLGQSFSYTHKEEVVHTEVMLPDNAPAAFIDRQTLWNAVEEKESRCNGRYARQYVIALPREWTREQSIERARAFIQEAFVDKGMAADWAFHQKAANPHLHIMVTVRKFNQNGTWAAMEKKEFAKDENGNRIPEIDPKTGEQKIRKRVRNGAESQELIWKRVTVVDNFWNSRKFFDDTKKLWAEHCNQYLPPDDQMEWRSYKQRGLERLPLLHEGSQARIAEKSGIILPVVQENRERREINQQLAMVERIMLHAKKYINAAKEHLARRREYDQTRSQRESRPAITNGGIAARIYAYAARVIARAGQERQQDCESGSQAESIRKRAGELIAKATEVTALEEHRKIRRKLQQHSY